MFLGSFLFFKEKYMPHFIFTVDLTDYLDAFIVIILVIILLIIAEIKDRHDQKKKDEKERR